MRRFSRSAILIVFRIFESSSCVARPADRRISQQKCGYADLLRTSSAASEDSVIASAYNGFSLLLPIFGKNLLILAPIPPPSV
jgi:hypothetical protein